MLQSYPAPQIMQKRKTEFFMANEKVLEMVGISKAFPGTHALDGVDFDIRKGEVHALCGENGAGKSTLMKVLAGSFNDYTGTIRLNGEEVLLHSPSIAKKLGIGMIYQELSLAQPLSIAENVLVGRLPKRGVFIDKKKMAQETSECLRRVGLERLDPMVPIEDISQSESQLVEIAKVLGNNPSVLVMDEPTSALSSAAVKRLFQIIRNLKESGISIVYISHHLPEIFEIADRITVLRDGKLIGTVDKDKTNREQIVQMMIGHSVSEFYQRVDHTNESVCRLEVKGFSRFGFFHDVGFKAYEGEIMGICGLTGAGRSELAKSLVGIDPFDEGQILLDGKPFVPKTYWESISKGLAYLTESRKEEGLALRLTVSNNILAGILPRLCHKGVLKKGAGGDIVAGLMKELEVLPDDPQRTVGNLSGGNQQKVLLSKWMAVKPRVLVLDEPTRGVDIGAKMIIHKAIEKLAEQGHTIILISSDLPELVSISNRIQIMVKGRLVKEMMAVDCTEESVLLAANEEAPRA